MKCFLHIFTTAVLSSAISLVNAAPFPDHPIKLIVPFTAGGNVDISARTIAQGLTEQLGQSIIVENKPGANTMIGTDFVAKSPADGYTLLLAGAEGLAINPNNTHLLTDYGTYYMVQYYALQPIDEKSASKNEVFDLDVPMGEQTENLARQKALENAGMIRAGKFPLSLHVDGKYPECSDYCSFRFVCRHPQGFKNTIY